MKLLTSIGIIALFLFSCQSSDCSNGQQDGNETGVDCGGDCAPCVPGGGGASTLSMLQGEWYLVASVNDLSSGTQDYLHLTIFEDTTTSKIVFTNQSYSGLQNAYVSYGVIGSGIYPTQHYYQYTSATNSINGMIIQKLTTDSLVVKNQNIYYYYVKNNTYNHFTGEDFHFRVDFDQTFTEDSVFYSIGSTSTYSAAGINSMTATMNSSTQGSASAIVYVNNSNNLSQSINTICEISILDDNGGLFFNTGDLLRCVKSNGGTCTYQSFSCTFLFSTQ